MTLPLVLIRDEATASELAAATRWTADHLHVPADHLTHIVAVAYVVRHFEMGQLSGWDGFVECLEN